MTFIEEGFRPFYHNFCAVKVDGNLKATIKDFPGEEDAGYALVYGYIDRDTGLRLEVLAACKKGRKYFHFGDPNDEIHSFIPIETVESADAAYFADEDNSLHARYAKKLEMLKAYDVSEDMEETRYLQFLDPLRNEHHPDDVRVILYRDGFQNEECWVRITGTGDHWLTGKLLNEPTQEFQCHLGDTINFYMQKVEDETFLAVADMNPKELTAEDLADGSLLKKAITEYIQDKNENSYNAALYLLRNSRVYIPGFLEETEESKRILAEAIAAGKDPEHLDEETLYTYQHAMTLSPIALERDGEKFYAVFSSLDEYTNPAEGCDLVDIPFINILQSITDQEELAGIIVNPFTESFVVLSGLFEHTLSLPGIGTAENNTSFKEPNSQGSPTQIPTPDAAQGEFFQNGNGELDMDVKPYQPFNFALYQNHISPVHGIRVLNATKDPMDGLTLRITSDFHFFKLYEMPLPSIPAGKPVSLPDPKLAINGSTLAGLTEEVPTVVTVEICKDGEPVAGYRNTMRVLAYDQYPGHLYINYLPAFIMPNHPAVPALLHDAGKILQKWGKSPSIEGYQSNNPSRIKELAAAAYAAIQKKNILYATAPANLWAVGQRIRTPEFMLDTRLGNCMEMTCLYAAVLEAMGLNAILYLIEGHIFAGFWLTESGSFKGDVVVNDNGQVLKRMSKGSEQLLLVECTAMCSGNKTDFDQAIYQLDDPHLAKEVFICALDVSKARLAGIKPMASRIKTDNGYTVNPEELDLEEITEPPKALDITIAEPVKGKAKAMTKQALWESKLLDLTRHNMLLSLPLNKSVEPILSTNLDELEDALADGAEFHVQPMPDWIVAYHREETDKQGKKKNIFWIAEMLEKHGVYEMTNWQVGDIDLAVKLRQEYKSHRLYTFFPPKELDKHLTALYRAAKASQQENGVSSLYLALGLLRWFDAEDTEHENPGYAPLVLLPIEIVRKSANQGYALHMRDEEPHFNMTLLEMLHQFYGLEINGLDPLPADDHGIDLKKVFATVRKAIFSIPYWDVVETCAIGNFSFAQFAMWNDLHTAGEILENNKVVRSLIKGHIDWDLNTPPEENTNLYLPITVDGTQLEAITMAAGGKTFVLHGPPGTGKSQTITAMIANLLANKKKVLFVAEKMAALTVVQKRLALMGIGDFCLELHSDKANKKHVLTQLEKALKNRFKYHDTEFKNSQENADAKRSQLDLYREHLHKIRPCGYTLRELIDRYETVSDVTEPICFGIDAVATLTKETLKEHVPLLKQLIAAGSAVDGLTTTPIRQIGLTEYNFTLRQTLKDKIADYRSAVSTAIKAGSDVAACFGIANPETKKEFVSLLELAEDAIQRKAIFDEIEEDLLTKCNPELFTADIPAILDKYAAAEKKIIGKNSAMAKVTQEVQQYFKKQIRFEWIPKLMKITDTYEEAAADLPFTPESNAYTICTDYLNAYQTFSDKESGFNALLKRKECTPDTLIKNEIDFCEFLSLNSKEIKDKALYNKVREKCLAAGLLPAVEAYEASPDRKDLIPAYRKGIYYALIYQTLSHDDILGTFSGATFNEAIQQFKLADDQLMDITRQEIYDLLAANIPGVSETPAISMQINLLRKAISSNARGMSIRQLFDRIPDILYRLAPCMLMSPNSVAQYLAQQNDIFDVVIFDEASQLPTCKAVGALARARNAIIVGDPKQMPPTSFFAGSGPVVEDLVLDDLDSILDDALALGIPSQHLQWHYRSKHESLIAFSNHQFYEGTMYTFPSANDRERHVTAVHVEGEYKKGVNAREAEALVAEIYRRYLDPALNKQSIGVVTFNVKQQDLIYNLLAKQFQADPEFDLWANSGEDPLFIKNLENVQGDERDVILFSIGYGPDEKGRISMNFGPINKQGGGKRLNVAFSRARITMMIFSSLYSTDIKITPTSPDGLVAFRDFLKYAEGGTLAEDELINEDEEEVSGILESICHTLQEKGYSYDTMIGHSDFRIDIAVINPFEPNEYLFGIMLDGENYRNTKNTRDREIAQAGVLKTLGWKLIRVWTVDWWDNKEKQISKLLSFAEKQKAAALAEHEEKEAKAAKAAEEEAQRKAEAEKMRLELEQQAEEVLSEEAEEQIPEPTSLPRTENDIVPEPDNQETPESVEETPAPAEAENESTPETKTEVPENLPEAEPVAPAVPAEKPKTEKAGIPAFEPVPYIYADLPVTEMNPADYAASGNRAEVQKRVSMIIETEAPILKETLIKRLLASFGVSKSATTLEATEKALKAVKVKNSRMKGIVFCWKPDADPAAYQGIRISNDRTAEELCPQEIRNAACYVLQSAGEMEKDTLLKEMSRVFGYKRLGKNLESALANGLAYAKTSGAVKVQDGIYSLPED